MAGLPAPFAAQTARFVYFAKAHMGQVPRGLLCHLGWLEMGGVVGLLFLLFIRAIMSPSPTRAVATAEK